MPPTETIDQQSPPLLDYPPLPPQPVSEEDFVNWCVADTWAEWVDGEIILRSPVSRRHDRLYSLLYRITSDIADASALGEVYSEPMHVRLGKRVRRSPDISFVSATRLSIVKDTVIDGPPDLIIEIVSPESFTRDWREKYANYQTAGVTEYWVIDPKSEMFEAYRHDGTRYARIPLAGGWVTSTALPGFRIRPEWLWQQPLPTVADALNQIHSAG